VGGKQAHCAKHLSHVHGPSALAGVWLRAEKSEISAALWAEWLRNDFNFYLFYLLFINIPLKMHKNLKANTKNAKISEKKLNSTNSEPPNTELSTN